MATTISKNLIGGVLGETIDQSGVNTYAERLAAALPGNRVLIDTQTASTSASLDFADAAMGDGTFDVIEVIATNIVPSTDAQGLEMLVSDDLGATYETAGNYHAGGTETNQAGTTTAVNNNGAASFSFTAGGVSNDASEGGVSFIAQCRMAGATPYFQFHMTGAYVEATSSISRGFYYGGAYTVGAVYNGLQFKFSGNMASGTIAVYGIKK